MARKELVIEMQENGCHICTSHLKRDKGYARIKVNGKFQSLHRIKYEEVHGKIQDGLIIRHKCDNRACVNPDHLEVGTHQDNSNDMLERNRHKTVPFIGEENPRAIITKDIVKLIRADKESTNKALAEKYGTTHSNVSLIRLKKSWKHIS